ncbi:MAG: site-2 protease family protein [Aeromicrobium sp.]
MKPRPTSRPAGTWRLWRTGDVDVLVRPSLLVMGAVLIVVFAGRFDGRTDTNPYLVATGFVLGLYVSVLVHELAHVAAARGFGMRVHSVTLHLLGGETSIEGESRRPFQELWIAIVGPLTSAAIGVIALAIGRSLEGTAATLLAAIGLVNLLVAAFNMIPGLPLDGGRVLRALIWAITGREILGIHVAAWIGRLTAIAAVVWAGLRPRDETYAVDLIVAALVAWFLWTGSSQALHHASRRSRVDGLVARDLAAPVPAPAHAVRLDADLRGQELLRRVAAQPAEEYALVDSDGSLVGVLTRDAIDAAYRSAR